MIQKVLIHQMKKVFSEEAIILFQLLDSQLIKMTRIKMSLLVHKLPIQAKGMAK